jgi:ribonuclease VapC
VIVVDTSALLAILLGEPEMTTFRDILAEAQRKFVSSVSLLETGIVITDRRGAAGVTALKDFVEQAEIEIIAFDHLQYELAIPAFQTFGKGRHVARLNICDCASYALAKSIGIPLLFKGNDFSATDIVDAKR